LVTHHSAARLIKSQCCQLAVVIDFQSWWDDEVVPIIVKEKAKPQARPQNLPKNRNLFLAPARDIDFKLTEELLGRF